MHLLISALQAAITLQCVVFALYLYLDHKLSSLANRVNFALLLILAAQLSFNLLQKHYFASPLPNLVSAFGLFYGLLNYFYIRALIHQYFCWRRCFYLHFAPVILFSLPPLFGSYLDVVVTFIIMGIYLLLAYRDHRHFCHVLSQTQSAQDQIAMRWTKTILLLNGCSVVLNVIAASQSYVFGLSSLGLWPELCLFLVLLVMVKAFILKGLLQPDLFAGITAEDEGIAALQKPTVGLEPQEVQRIKQLLMNHKEQKKPYLDPLFNLQSLGRQLGETPRQVSIVINTTIGKSFSDFVNDYRIREVKPLLSNENEQCTILDIIYACGFSTKSNFNRAFKKMRA